MILKIVVLAICTAFFGLLLKKDFGAGTLLLSLSCCGVLFFICINLADELLSGFEKLKKLSGINSECVEVITKTIAVTYVTGFGVDVCMDAGEKAIAAVVETAGKLVMLTAAFPLIGGIFESITKMLG